MARIAILTLPGFNEIDSLVALRMLSRTEGLDAFLAGPEREVVSGCGVPCTISGTMDDIAAADAVVVGSGRYTADFAADTAFMAALKLDSRRQLIASQCSGALLLARLGLLDGLPVCTDNLTRPAVENLGLRVTGETMVVHGNVATVGGCLAAQNLATWLLLRLAGEAETRRALAYVVPVGEAESYTENLIATVQAADPAVLDAARAAANA
jgi:transcriptional regulator GlxA family with amidase domain